MASKYQREVYNKEASQQRGGRSQRIEKIRKILYYMIRDGGKKKILDIGCGDRKLVAPLCRKNHCYGVDVARSPLRRAKEGGMAVIQSDFERGGLPFKDNCFDIVICSEVIEHVVNTDHLLREINRVLPQDYGHVVLSFPNVAQPLSWLMLILDYPPKYSARYKSPHVRDFTLKTMRVALENSGFQLEHVEGTSRLTSKIPRLSDQIIVTASKVDRPRGSPAVVWDVRTLWRESNGRK